MKEVKDGFQDEWTAKCVRVQNTGLEEAVDQRTRGLLLQHLTRQRYTRWGMRITWGLAWLFAGRRLALITYSPSNYDLGSECSRLRNQPISVCGSSPFYPWKMEPATNRSSNWLFVLQKLSTCMSYGFLCTIYWLQRNDTLRFLFARAVQLGFYELASSSGWHVWCWRICVDCCAGAQPLCDWRSRKLFQFSDACRLAFPWDPSCLLQLRGLIYFVWQLCTVPLVAAL